MGREAGVDPFRRRRRGPLAQGLRDARRNLKRALAEKSGAGPDEQKRIIEILLRAAREIRGQ